MAVLGEGFRDFAVCSEGEVDHSYPIGRFGIVPQGEPVETLSFSIIVIGIAEDGKVLVAFPHKAWHRRAQNRLLPPNTITKGLCLEVGACQAEARQDLWLARFGLGGSAHHCCQLLILKVTKQLIILSFCWIRLPSVFHQQQLCRQLPLRSSSWNVERKSRQMSGALLHWRLKSKK